MRFSLVDLRMSGLISVFGGSELEQVRYNNRTDMLPSFVQADRAQMACSNPILCQAWVTTSPLHTPASNATSFYLTGKNLAQMKIQLQSVWAAWCHTFLNVGLQQ